MERLHEVVDAGDPVLEQVADAGAVGQQFSGVGVLDVLGEYEDRQAWDVFPGAQRSLMPSSVKDGGRRTSTTATSGRWVMAAVTKDSASSVVASTSFPRASSSAVSPCASSALSSAITIRTGTPR